ncbi:hypothetical protein KKA94_03320 [Patescibacteria group bacterium]|nr:hypothetical protein [Patescibacteria group bacterium]
MNKILSKLNLIFIPIFIFSFLWMGLVQAQDYSSLGLDYTDDPSYDTPALGDDPYGLRTTANAAQLDISADVPTLAGRVIGTALSVIGILFFIIILYGGIIWMTSRGKQEQSKKALDAIVAASIGLIIVLAAYAITDFVFNTLSVG